MYDPGYQKVPNTEKWALLVANIGLIGSTARDRDGRVIAKQSSMHASKQGTTNRRSTMKGKEEGRQMP